jgi:hypothetical protein
MESERSRLLNREDAVCVIQSLYQGYVDHNHRLPRMLIAVGGTAMALHAMRPLSEDIDLYAPEDAFLENAMQLERDTGMRIDVTSKTTLWGDLNVIDIEADAQVKGQVDVVMNGVTFHVDIAAISPETLFVIKASTMREKDRDDLPSILQKTSPNKVFQRADTLLRNMDRYIATEIIRNIISEMQMVTLEMIPLEWLDGCSFLKSHFQETLDKEFSLHISSIKMTDDTGIAENSVSLESDRITRTAQYVLDQLREKPRPESTSDSRSRPVTKGPSGPS